MVGAGIANGGIVMRPYIVDEVTSPELEVLDKTEPTELSKAMDLSNWGPVGTPEQIIEWFRTFAKAGVDHFICRFGSLDQFGQVDRFARDVLPVLRAEGTSIVAGR